MDCLQYKGIKISFSSKSGQSTLVLTTTEMEQKWKHTLDDFKFR